MIKRVRRGRRALAFETVESRTLLSGVGVNLEFNWSYFGNSLWADVSNEMGVWYQEPTTPTTPLGYPLANASTYAYLDNYPNGIYQVSFKGTATLTFRGTSELMEPMVKGADGVTRGRVRVGDDLPAVSGRRQMIMAVSDLDANDPMSDLHIWSPGYEPGGPVYTSEFIHSLQPFDYIRFLNWSATNNTTLSDWSDRPTEDAFPRTDTEGSSKIAYETMIALANEAGKDIWLTVPALANQQFVENLAKLVRERLSPNLNIYIEYSNETWNGAFRQYQQVLGLAKANPLVTATGDLGKVAQESALRIKWISDIFRDEFAESFDRVIPVFGGWTITPSFLQTGLERIRQLYGDPSQFVKSAAIAPYIALPKGINKAQASVSELMAGLNQGLDSLIPSIKQNAQIAAAYGLPLDTYEGGQHMWRQVDEARELAVLNAPGMYDLYRRYYAEWIAAGGRQMTYFTSDGPFWGLKPVVTSPGAQRWDAVLSTILQPGDANLDGVVDFADFQILAANYAQSGRWWEQGDFNHDGVVNEADLAALVSRLDVGSLTADQAVEILTFSTMGPTAVNRALEMGLFAREYASDYAFASASNSGGGIVRDGAFNGSEGGGGALTLNGVSHGRGLGVSGVSSIDFDLSGNFTSFSSIIGVDDRAGAGRGRATFQVLGDGRVLYVSPAMSAGDAAIPIEVDVRGVSKLSLVVTSPAGADQLAPADWAQARFVDARSTSGESPLQLRWSVTKNGETITSTAAESFIFAASAPANYVLTVQATDRHGNTASRDIALEMRATGGVVVPESRFHGFNRTTGGTWRGGLGADGGVIAGDSANPPSYARVSVRGAALRTWEGAGVNSDPRALQRISAPGRVAAAWAGNQFTIDVAVSGDRARGISLYLLDWDSAGRTQRIDLIDAATGKVLDSRTVSNFENGVYLTWSVSNSVRFRVTSLAGGDAVVGGVFFEEETAPVLGRDAGTLGTWRGSYGVEGVAIAGDSIKPPAKGSITISGGSVWKWEQPTTDPRGLQRVNGSDRLAAAWLGNEFIIDVTLPNDKVRAVSLHALDWSRVGRVQRIDLIDPASGMVIDSRLISEFDEGIYLSWNVRGSARFRITRIEGANAVISGVFIDGVESSSSTYAGTDQHTLGSWKGVRGLEGRVIAGHASQTSPGASVSVSGGSVWQWERSTSDPRGPQKVDAPDRMAAAWIGNEFTIDVTLADNKTRVVSLHALDWSRAGRVQRIDVISLATGMVIDSRTISNFESGIYLSWKVKGSVRFKITKVEGANAAISGVFIDGVDSAPTPNTATFTGTDETTLGSWRGVRGQDGRVIAGHVSQPSPGASVSVVGGGVWQWERSTSDPRGTQKVDAPDRLASAWVGNQFTIDVALPDDKARVVSLHALDWSRVGRVQRIDVIDPSTGAVIDSRTISDFENGIYLSWSIKGSVRFKITKVEGANAAISGVFIDDAEPASTPPLATFAGTDETTLGSWRGVRGQDGRVIAGHMSQTTPGASVNVGDGGVWQWEQSTTDPRGLQKVDASGRLAAAWVGNQFTIDVALPDNKIHTVSLHALDWSRVGRVQRIDVIDPSTGAVLDSRTISHFESGIYLSWNVKGSVRFKITKVEGANAVISGVFIDDAESVPTPPPATFAGTDETTLGSWRGVRGQDGRVIAGHVSQTPAIASAAVVDASFWQWERSTTDARGLQKVDAPDRMAAAWIGNEFTIDVAFADNKTHTVSLHALDWSRVGRVQRIDVIDPATGAVIDSRTISDFGNGIYLSWNIKGSVRFKITKVEGANAAISGIFFD